LLTGYRRPEPHDRSERRRQVAHDTLPASLDDWIAKPNPTWSCFRPIKAGRASGHPPSVHQSRRSHGASRGAPKVGRRLGWSAASVPLQSIAPPSASQRAQGRPRCSSAAAS
jgi:hypothetical protein